MKIEAKFYEKLNNNKVNCRLCPHNCIINENNFGKCRVRVNKGGKLYTTNYGEITSIALDPIEKKPLYYFKPSTHILSVGSVGCNFTCSFCQNYNISQHSAESRFLSPEQLTRTILAAGNNIGIAFTYNEPTIWYEYVYDCAKLLKDTDESSSVVLVTNGYINKEPLKKLIPYVDAMNIDLKSFNNKYYGSFCGGDLKPVLNTIKISSEACHVEITNLLVTDENDSIDEVESIAKFLGSIDKNIPLHITRYFPRYKLNNPPTDIDFMLKSQKIAKKYLNRVCLGNI